MSLPGGWSKIWDNGVQSKSIKTNSYTGVGREEADVNVIHEQAVTLSVNNEYWLTFMCTPTQLEALAVGFLFNEKIIQTANEVASVRVCQNSENVDVWLSHAVKKPEHWVHTSGCSGGETSIVETSSVPRKTIPQNGFMLSSQLIGNLLREFRQSQELYKQTGGVHTSALSDGESILLIAEDIGRHNTLDKLAGCCLLGHVQPPRRIILTTGRVSSEMIQKSIRMGAMSVISRTSPTSLSVEMAERSGITLVGYARPNRFIVYSHPERILTSPMGEIASREVI